MSSVVTAQTWPRVLGSQSNQLRARCEWNMKGFYIQACILSSRHLISYMQVFQNFSKSQIWSTPGFKYFSSGKTYRSGTLLPLREALLLPGHLLTTGFECHISALDLWLSRLCRWGKKAGCPVGYPLYVPSLSHFLTLGLWYETPPSQILGEL